MCSDIFQGSFALSPCWPRSPHHKCPPLFPLLIKKTKQTSSFLPCNHTHMQWWCFGVRVPLWPPLFLFSSTPSVSHFLIPLPVSLAVCLSSVSRSHTHTHTQQTHHQPLNFCPAHNAGPHKKYASITTTVLWLTCKHTQRGTRCRLNTLPNIHENHKKLQSKYVWWKWGIKLWRLESLQGCHSFDFPERHVLFLLFVFYSSLSLKHIEYFWTRRLWRPQVSRRHCSQPLGSRDIRENT